MRARIDWPSIGAPPPVEMATTTGERLTIVPNWKSHSSGRSMMLTGAPAARAAATKAVPPRRDVRKRARHRSQLQPRPTSPDPPPGLRQSRTSRGRRRTSDVGARGGEQAPLSTPRPPTRRPRPPFGLELVEQRQRRERARSARGSLQGGRHAHSLRPAARRCSMCRPHSLASSLSHHQRPARSGSPGRDRARAGRAADRQEAFGVERVDRHAEPRALRDDLLAIPSRTAARS